MTTIISSLTLLLLLLAFSTHIFGLPANWFIIAILALWDWLAPDSSLSFNTLLIFTGMAFIGECIEFVLQAFGAQKYGASRSGNWGAILGAIAGALLGAPFLFGLGALAGAIGGAYLGCLGIELLNNRPLAEAKQAAWGAMLGKVLGMSLKIGIGIVLLVQAADLLF